MSGLIHTVYFVRHGLCVGNVTGETLAPEDDVLNDFGRKQSAELGKQLKDVKFTRAFASTYERAIETAKEILAQSSHPRPKIQEDWRIKEREMGDLIGLSAKEIGIKILGQLKEGKKFDELEVPGGESVAEYVGRIESFFGELFTDLSKSEEPENVLVASHGLFMTRFLVGLRDTFAGLCTVTEWDKRCASTIENTACTSFSLSYSNNEVKPALTFLSVHNTDHLKKLKESGEAELNKAKYAMSEDDRRKIIELVMQIPGAKDQVSGCVQV